MHFCVIIGAIAVTALLIGGDSLAFAFESSPLFHPFTAVVAVAVVGARAERVIALYALPDFLGVRRSQIAEAVKRGLLHPFTPLGGRRKVVLESEVAALQARAIGEAAAAAEAAKAAATKPAAVETASATPPIRKRKREVEARAL
jgi:hypothetical protein